MQAMQYEITLPADYDMAIIRHRVATRGSTTDHFDGLGLKAYGIRERGVNGSPVNQYAPFYFWHSLEGMNRFLWGGPFAGLAADFGRPRIRQWTGLAFERGPASATTPRGATRRTQPIAADADATKAIDAAIAETRERARSATVHSTALAVDTWAWELAHFTLWDGPAPESATTYEVLHLSSPHLSDLEVGRQW